MLLIFWLLLLSPPQRVGDRMVVVGQDFIDVPANLFRRLANRFQPAVRCPKVTPLQELPA